MKGSLIETYMFFSKLYQRIVNENALTLQIWSQISAIELNEEIYRINDSRWVLPYLEPIFPLGKGALRFLN